MALAHFRMWIHELLNEDPDMVTREATLIILDSKSDRCMAKNGMDTKYTLPGFAENFANLCTANLNSTLVDNI